MRDKLNRDKAVRRRRAEPVKLEVSYRRLDALYHLPRNGKAHDVGAIVASLREFGMLDPIGVNDRTGHDIDGNGRLIALRAMMAENGKKPPRGVMRDGEDGMWLVPVVSGVRLSERDEERAAVALNRTPVLGGFDDGALAAVLSDLAAAGELDGTGYDGDDVDALLRKVGRVKEVTIEPEGEVEPQPDEGHVMLPIMVPPESAHDILVGLSLVMQVRKLAFPWQALIWLVGEYRQRLVITEGANGPV